MSERRHYCPACGAGLVASPVGGPLRCAHCGWHLITRAAWNQLSPFLQGYVHYMQASWPSSELATAANPHAEASAAHEEFERGQQRAMLDVQDGEE